MLKPGLFVYTPSCFPLLSFLPYLSIKCPTAAAYTTLLYLYSIAVGSVFLEQSGSS
ncbi:hypothetical protein V8C43DRAFT_273189 [Trichoderma afarasin]